MIIDNYYESRRSSQLFATNARLFSEFFEAWKTGIYALLLLQVRRNATALPPERSSHHVRSTFKPGIAQPVSGREM
jgi:hypothetical protein